MLHPTVKLCQSDTYSGGTAFCIFFFFFPLIWILQKEKKWILSVEKFCEMLREFFHSSILQDFILLVIFSQNFGRLEPFLRK